MMTDNDNAQADEEFPQPDLALKRLGVFVGEWRDFPGFSQRFSGTFSDDNNVITADSNWEDDFDLTCTRVS